MIIIICATLEVQFKVCIDFIWMREIFEIIVWMQDDEIDEMVDYIIDIEHLDDMQPLDDVDETVQIDEK